MTTAQALDRAAEAVDFLRGAGVDGSGTARPRRRGVSTAGSRTWAASTRGSGPRRRPGASPERRRSAAVRRRGAGPLRAARSARRSHSRPRRPGHPRERPAAHRGAPRALDGDLAARLVAWTRWPPRSRSRSTRSAPSPSCWRGSRAPARAASTSTAAAARVPTHLGLRSLLVRVAARRAAAARSRPCASCSSGTRPTPGRTASSRSCWRSGRASTEALAAARARRELEPEAAATLGVRGLLLRGRAARPRTAQCFARRVERRSTTRGGRGRCSTASARARRQAKALRFLARARRQRNARRQRFFTLQRRSRGILEPAEVLACSRRRTRSAPTSGGRSRRSPTSSRSGPPGRRRGASSRKRAALPAGGRAVDRPRPRRAASRRRRGRDSQFLEKAMALAPGWTLPLQRPGRGAPAHGRAPRRRPRRCAARARSTRPTAASRALRPMALRERPGNAEAAYGRRADRRARPADGWAWNTLPNWRAATRRCLARRIAAGGRATRKRSSPWCASSRHECSTSSSGCSNRCWRRNRATPTPTTCAPCCSPRPTAPGSARRLLASCLRRARLRTSSRAGAPGCSTAPAGAAKRWRR